MPFYSREFTIYGLQGHKDIINTILADLKMEDREFEIRLILTEAIVNAFQHGNKKNETRPIIVRCQSDEMCLKIEVEDCGNGFNIHNNIPALPDDLMEENGRGLYLISCFVDKIQYMDNRLIIEKILAN